MRFIFDEVPVILFDKKQWLRFLIYQNENNLHFFSFIYIYTFQQIQGDRAPPIPSPQSKFYGDRSAAWVEEEGRGEGQRRIAMGLEQEEWRI